MEGGFFNTMQMRILGGLAILMFMITMASYATLNFEKVEFLNPAPATISVSGEGEALAVPDIGQFSFSVNAEGTGAAEAQEESGTKINAILAYLKEQGIEDKDIKTQNYNLREKWKYEQRICPVGSYCPGERVKDGFEVTQTVSVKLRDTDMSGTVIAGIGELGATNISSLNFTVDDMDALRAEARAAAIEDAKKKAAVLAEQLNVRVVRLVAFNESGGYYQPKYMDTRMMAMEMAEDEGFGGADMPVGEESTTVRVDVVYEVR